MFHFSRRTVIHILYHCRVRPMQLGVSHVGTVRSPCTGLEGKGYVICPAIYVVMLCFTVALCILPRDPVIHLHPMASVNLTRCANSSILQGMPPVDPVSCQPRVMVLSMTLLHLYSSYCTQYIVVLDPKRMQHLEGTIISIPHAVRMT